MHVQVVKWWLKHLNSQSVPNIINDSFEGPTLMAAILLALQINVLNKITA